jgi:hypothetical protein
MSAVFLCPKKIKMKPKKSYIAGAEVYISSRPKRTFDWNSIWNSQVKSGNRSGSSVEKAPNTHEICTKIPEYGYPSIFDFLRNWRLQYIVCLECQYMNVLSSHPKKKSVGFKMF